jgi:hypothetical protein
VFCFAWMKLYILIYCFIVYRLILNRDHWNQWGSDYDGFDSGGGFVVHYPVRIHSSQPQHPYPHTLPPNCPWLSCVHVVLLCLRILNVRLLFIVTRRLLVIVIDVWNYTWNVKVCRFILIVQVWSFQEVTLIGECVFVFAQVTCCNFDMMTININSKFYLWYSTRHMSFTILIEYFDIKTNNPNIKFKTQSFQNVENWIDLLYAYSEMKTRKSNIHFKKDNFLRSRLLHFNALLFTCDDSVVYLQIFEIFGHFMGWLNLFCSKYPDIQSSSHLSWFQSWLLGLVLWTINLFLLWILCSHDVWTIVFDW